MKCWSRSLYSNAYFNIEILVTSLNISKVNVSRPGSNHSKGSIPQIQIKKIFEIHWNLDFYTVEFFSYFLVASGIPLQLSRALKMTIFIDHQLLFGPQADSQSPSEDLQFRRFSIKRNDTEFAISNVIFQPPKMKMD